MSDELYALRAVKAAMGEIAGFSAVVVPDCPAETLTHLHPAAAMMAASVGPYGHQTTGGCCNGFDWAGVLPGPTEILSTWSEYNDDAGICVVEGDFYAEAWERRPQIGIDEFLAKTLWAEFQKRGPDCVNELSGLFSGFMFSKDQRRLWFFVDHSGSRLLHYRVEAGRCEIASSIYGLRAGIRPLALDPLGVNEAIFFKAHLDHTTMFRGVYIAPPGKVVEFDGRDFKMHRYHRYPQRRQRMSKAEIGESICSSLERQIRYLRFTDDAPTIGLSGGKDSRIICSAMAHAGLRPHGLTFVDASQEQFLSQQIAEACGLTTEPVYLSHLETEEDIVGASCDAAVLSDGFTPGYGFQVLAACARRHNRALFTGFVGDHVSGSSSGVSLRHVKTLEKLSDLNYMMMGKVYNTDFISMCLLPELRVPLQGLREHWLSIYRREYADFNDFMSAHMSVRIEQYNRRFASVFHAMRPAVTLVQMFAGRDVIDAYLSLPIGAINGAKGHILAAMHRYPALGRIPTAKLHGRMSLKWEYHLWRFIEAISRWRRLKVKRLARKQIFQPGDPARADLRTRRFFEAISKSQMFDVSYRKNRLEPLLYGNINPHIHTLASVAIHVELALHNTFLLPPLWLPNRGSSSMAPNFASPT